MLRNIFSQWYKYVVWALMSLFFWGWIFTLLTDAPMSKKLVLCDDAPQLRDEALAEALSGDLPEGIRQVAVHRFDYYVFDQDELLHADVYLVPESAAADYIESFRPLAETGLEPGAHGVWEYEGVALGLRLDGEAGSFLGEGEWLLCFGVDSAHRDDGTALWLAERVLSLP